MADVLGCFRSLLNCRPVRRIYLDNDSILLRIEGSCANLALPPRHPWRNIRLPQLHSTYVATEQTIRGTIRKERELGS